MQARKLGLSPSPGTVKAVWGSLRTMARKLRVEYPGAVYQVMNRGDRREPIFRDDADGQ